MEVLITNDFKKNFENQNISLIYGDIKNLKSFNIEYYGIEYNDDWTVKKFLINNNPFKKKRLMFILNFLEIDKNIINIKLKMLSRTNFKFILLAYAIINNYNNIIFDHFDTTLIYKEQKKLIRIINKLVKEGASILIISHNIRFLSLLNKKIVLFDGDELLFRGTFDNLLSEYHGLIKDDSIINFIDKSNKKNAKLSYTFDSHELIKDIFRRCEENELLNKN